MHRCQERETKEQRKPDGKTRVYTSLDIDIESEGSKKGEVRGHSQLSTFMKAYTAYARGEGVWDHRTLFPRKSTFIFNH